MRLPDEMSHVSNVHTHSEVAAGQLLNGQRVIQIPGCWRVYAEQPACAAEGNYERRHGKFAVVWQCLSEHMLQIVMLTSSMVTKQRGGALKSFCPLGHFGGKGCKFGAKGKRRGTRKENFRLFSDCKGSL